LIPAASFYSQAISIAITFPSWDRGKIDSIVQA
jgi:hypothetical protein